MSVNEQISGHIQRIVGKMVDNGRAGVSTMTLASLRYIRDNSPKEWDALMRSQSGHVMCSLWDYLLDLEKKGVETCTTSPVK